MMIKSRARIMFGIMVGAIALPLAAQAQTADTRTRTRATPPAATTPTSPPAPAQGGTLDTTGKGTGTTTATPPPVGGPDDARANQDRTNSPAATSGEVDGRNALSPATALPGPSGAPAVGRR